MTGNNIKVVYYPAFSNPYQKLLYSALKKQNNTVSVPLNTKFDDEHFLVWFFMLPIKLFLLRLRGYRIFHLHWQHFQVPVIHNIIGYYLNTFYALYFLILVKLYGYQLVWTVHNIVPHKRRFIDDLFITKLICKISTACIVHSSTTIEELSALNISTQKCVIIPHGSYIGYYENSMTRQEARELLEIQDTDFVFLFIGQLRMYKGVLELLEHFKKVAVNNDNIKLIVAGSCLDDYILQSIVRYKKDLGDRLITNLANIPDEDIQMYMNASDVVVFPFRKVTTSGSIFLAMSFGKPVIYPVEFFEELPNEVGFNYKNINDLYRTMKNASVPTDLKEKGTNAKNYAAQFTWTDIAEKTYELYKSIS